MSGKERRGGVTKMTKAEAVKARLVLGWRKGDRRRGCMYGAPRGAPHIRVGREGREASHTRDGTACILYNAMV